MARELEIVYYFVSRREYRMKLKAVLVVFLSFLFLQSCGDAVVGQDGVYFPWVGGDYTRESITDGCSASFDSAVSIVQDVKDVIVSPGGVTLSSLVGAVDKDGNLTLKGVNLDPASDETFSCTGTFADGLITLLCDSTSADCTVSFSRL